MTIIISLRISGQEGAGYPAGIRPNHTAAGVREEQVYHRRAVHTGLPVMRGKKYSGIQQVAEKIPLLKYRLK